MGTEGGAPVPLACILAGGRGRRMGVDKVSLPLDGVPLIERVWCRVAPVAERVAAVGGTPHLEHRGVPTIPDRFPGANALGGIATALEYASETIGPRAAVLCVACDMPLLEPGLLVYLYELSPGWDVVVPRVSAGFEPLCAVYRTTCLPALRAQLARHDLGIRDLFGQVQTREVGETELRRLDPDLRSFLNVNRPADLDLARQLLAGAA